MSFRDLLRLTFALVAAATVVLGGLADTTAQLPGGPDIDPFESDLSPTQPTTPDAGTPATGPEGEQRSAEELIQEAIQYFEDGDFNNAYQIENAFLTQFRGAPGPLSVHYYENGEYAKAIQITDFFLARNPNAPGPNLIRGKSLIAIGENELALQALANAAAYSPSAEPDYERGKIYHGMRDYKNAVTEFNKAVQKSAFNAEYLVMRGKAQLRLAQLSQQSPSLLGTPNTTALVEQAMASLERAIGIDSENAEAYMQRSYANSFLGNMDEAVADAEQAVSLASDDVQFAARLGLTYKSRADAEKFAFDKDLGQAVADYNRAIEAFETYLQVHGDPDNQDEELADDPEAIVPKDVYLARALTRVSLANTIPAAGRPPHYQQAIDDCNRAIEFDLTGNERATALLQRGIAERLLGQNEVAIETFTAAITAAGAFPEASLRRGIVYLHLGNLDSAEADFEQAALELRRDGRASFWLGVTLARRGEFGDAIRFYSAALRENSGFKPAYNNRGLAYLRIGRYRQAANDFSALLQSDPNDEVARSRRDLARQLLAKEESGG